jgi:AcrR family transcriptional regulator
MSYLLTPIAVDLARITAALGSKDQSLFDTLVERYGDDFAQIDALRDDGDDDDDEPPVPSTHDALRHLIFAHPYHPAAGFKYAYALEYILKYFGDHLSNDHWFSMRSEWAETVDTALAAAGVPEQTFRVGPHLMYRGSPVPIPDPDDFPFVGYLRTPEIPAALTVLRTATLPDPEVAQAVAEIRTWLETCVTTHRDLVCYYA